MADSYTPNFNLVLPEVGASFDTWGEKCNANFSAIDAQLVPSGGIIMWSGSVVSIPDGWYLCNGANGTPDLRGRFIVGAGSSYDPGDTGGASSVTLTEAQMPAHDHSGSTGSAGGHNHNGNTSTDGYHGHSGSTNTTGNHRHSISTQLEHDGGSAVYITRSGQTRGGTKTGYTNYDGNHSHSLSINGNGNHNHSFTTSSVGNHTHSVSVGNAGGGGSHENRPPYYALAYIMKG